MTRTETLLFTLATSLETLGIITLAFTFLAALLGDIHFAKPFSILQWS